MHLPKAFPGALRQSSQVSLARCAPLLLRFIVGYGFMNHGYAKIARGPEHFAGILAAMGVPGPHVMTCMTILVELVGGLAVLLGAFVPVIAVPMAAISGYETDLFVSAVSQRSYGSGALSIEAWLRRVCAQACSERT